MDLEEIEHSYRQGQSDTVAFDLESASPHHLAETLASMANLAGGTLLLGVDPRTNAIRGIRAVDELTNA
ncbi:MAG: ATP-binding protein [Chloroflexi bacterium]|nr:ATP-binding protein [Chloroflexota bacterium]